MFVQLVCSWHLALVTINWNLPATKMCSILSLYPVMVVAGYLQAMMQAAGRCRSNLQCDVTCRMLLESLSTSSLPVSVWVTAFC